MAFIPLLYASVLQQVLDIVEERADESYRNKVQARISSWAPAREAAGARRHAAAAAQGVQGAINPAYLFARLSAALSPNDIVVNEAIRNAPLVQQHLRRTEPGSYVGLAGGGLGFSGGMALGLKLAQPSRRVVQVVGDGAFHFSAPDSVYATAQQYQLPIFTVVLDNGGWQAVKASVQRVYPDGMAQRTNSFQSQLASGRQGELRRFAEVVSAFGAHGETVADEAGSLLDIRHVVQDLAESETLYLCGPQGMIDAALSAERSLGFVSNRIRYERFQAPPPTDQDTTFEVVLASSGETLQVAKDETILDVLIRAGKDPLYECKRGDCGLCLVGVLDGAPDHRDTVLSEDEKRQGNVIQVCVSRALSPSITLDI
jgi:ferredoxin